MTDIAVIIKSLSSRTGEEIVGNWVHKLLVARSECYKKPFLSDRGTQSAMTEIDEISKITRHSESNNHFMPE